jgi:FixJ family two-component response regulator
MACRPAAGYLGGMRAIPVVAIVDDDASMRDATDNLLQAAGFTTATFSDALSFLASAQRRAASCAVVDMRMPGMTGLELYKELVARGERIPIVLVTAYPEDAARAEARKAGIVCFLAKPFAPTDLLGCVREALGDPIPKS